MLSAAPDAHESRFRKLGLLPGQRDSLLGCFRRDEWVESVGLPNVALIRPLENEKNLDVAQVGFARELV